jgi:hypothetical protein
MEGGGWKVEKAANHNSPFSMFGFVLSGREILIF